MNQMTPAAEFVSHLLSLKMCGRMGPRLPPPPRRWELREKAGERHHHQKMRSKRLRQLALIEAKKAAARTLARRGTVYPSKKAILREIRSAPHVYL